MENLLAKQLITQAYHSKLIKSLYSIMTKTKETPISTADYILRIALSLVVVMIGTGIYEADLMPKDEILVPLLAFALLAASFNYKRDINFIENRIFIGFLIFNIYFMLSITLHTQPDLEIKAYFIHLISIGSFLAIYTATKIFLSSGASSTTPKNNISIAALSITALFVLLTSQLWQAYYTYDTFMMRPGGFLNPNTTAALSLIFMFSALKCLGATNKNLILLSVTLSACIVFLAQSRGSMLFLIPFVLYSLYNFNRKQPLNIYLLGTAALLLIFTLYQTGTLELMQSALSRFKGDLNSIARLDIIVKGFYAFLESPVWGNGYLYLANTYSLSSHNQIIESLASFGLIGTITICVAFYYLYTPCSLLFCTLCILPVLLFSHNFFDSYSYQAALGVALAVDRTNNSKFS